MNKRLLTLRNRIDAMTVRERGMLFGAAVAVLAFVGYALLLEPLFARQKTLRARISQQQNNIQGIDAEIKATVQAHAVDPDAANRARLAAVTAATAKRTAALRSVQNGLVAPERIVPLLDGILRANRRLRLVSLKSLPASPLLAGALADTGAAPPAAPAGSPISAEAAMAARLAASTTPAAHLPPALPRGGQIYRHGVELALRGNYLDMVNYMEALEAMPSQLFWGKAALEVEDYPTAHLTLTLYTLSLDPKWMSL